MSSVIPRTFLVLALSSLLSPYASAQQIMVTVSRGAPPPPVIGGPADPLNGPQSVVFDSQGNLFISDTGSGRVRRMDKSGNITTVAGTGTPGSSGDGGKATSAQLRCPAQIVFDKPGNLYIADPCDNRVRKVVPGADQLITGTASDEIISTYAGNGALAGDFPTDGVPANTTAISGPLALAMDQGGNLFIASQDPTINLIRRVDASGIISTTNFENDNRTYSLAFDNAGDLLFAVDNGIEMASPVPGSFLTGQESVNRPISYTSDFPPGMAFDKTGNLYFSNGGNAVFKVTSGSDGLIASGSTGSIYAGNAGFGGAGYTGDGGSPTAAMMNAPSGLAVNGAGNLFIADTGNNVIRAVITGAPTDGSAPVTALDQNGNPSPVHLTFNGSVAKAGFTAVVVGPGGPPLPANFNLAGSFFDVFTTALYAPTLTVCVDPPFPSGASLIHFTQATQTWDPDTSFVQGTEICTTVNSLSPFAIVTPSIVDQAPAITSANSATFQSGVVASFTVTATGTPVPTITGAGALPGAVTFVDNGNGTGTLSGTPAASTGGVYPITFTASNGVGSSATQRFTLTVNQGPSITSASSTTFTMGVAGAFTVTTQGFPAPSLTETGALPGGVTFADNHDGTGTLSGTPSGPGTFNISFTAANGVGSGATQSFTLNVPGSTTLTLAVTPGSINFGNVDLYHLATSEVTLQNTGTLPVSISNMSLTFGAHTDWDDFFFVSFCKPSLAAGKSCTIYVIFFADELGPKAATLKITSNAPGSPLAVGLTGTAVRGK